MIVSKIYVFFNAYASLRYTIMYFFQGIYE